MAGEEVFIIGFVVFIVLVIAIWIGYDANQHGQNACLWIMFALIGNGAGIIIYLIVRSNWENPPKQEVIIKYQNAPQVENQIATGSSLYCSKCGEYIPNPKKFCDNCGSAL